MKESSAMKTSKNNGTSLVGLLKVGLGLGLGLGAAGSVLGNGISLNIVQQFFSVTTPANGASPLAPLPSLTNAEFDILPWAGLPSDLVCVKLEITTQLMYNGMLVSQLANEPFSAQVRSDFTVNFVGTGTAPGSITDLDPVVLLSGQSPSTPQTLFPVSQTKPASRTVTLGTTASELAPFTTATVPVFVTANLRTDTLPGFDNTSDLGLASPAAFVNDPKVQPSFGAQFYELKTTLIVTYFVPETSAPIAALATLGLGWFFLRRRVK